MHPPSATEGSRQWVAGAGNRKPSAFPETRGRRFVSGPATDLGSTTDLEKIVYEVGAKSRVPRSIPKKVTTETRFCLCSSAVP